MSIISRVFVENNTFLKNYLRKLLSSEEDIEDITQEAFIKASVAEKTTDIKYPKSFLFRVARNLALDEIGRKSRQMTTYIEDAIASIPIEKTPTIESEVEAQESIELYFNALENLSDKCRQIFILRKVYGLKHREIAKKMNVTVSNVEKQLKIAVMFCAKYSEEQKAELGDEFNSGIDSEKRNAK